MFENKQPLTSLSELGEFGLINHLNDKITLINKSTIKGIGDDAAVLEYSANRQILVSSDLLVEGIHFDLSYTPLKHLGYKAAIVNFSDIYAMNGKPEHITVNIAMSNRFSLEAVDELYEGILLACKNYEVDLVGGDTSSSKSGLFISITVIGQAGADKITYRNGAKSNDLICVSGDLGGAYMGLQLLEREKQVFLANPEMQPEIDNYDYILERQLKPEAREDIIKLLEKENIKPTSMIDISDGLASELIHICTSSNVGCTIYDDKIPMDHTTIAFANEINMDPVTATLNGGEDYELLFTIDIKDYNKIKEIKVISVIGHITDKSEGCNIICGDNKELVLLKAQGWNAF